MNRRLLLTTGFAVMLALAAPEPAGSQAAVVPAKLQAELLSKLVGYDRNFAGRAGKVARVALLTDPNDARSVRAATALELALSRIETLGGLPHEETVLPFQKPAQVAQAVSVQHFAVVYVTPGLDPQIAEIRKALSGISVLTVAGVPEYVPDGIVIGFEMQSGKAKLALNRKQASLQRVDFSADVLRLMKVYQ